MYAFLSSYYSCCMLQWAGRRLAGEFQWTNRYNISCWQWPISDDNLWKRLSMWRSARGFRYQFGDNGRMANSHNQITRNGCVQLRNEPTKANNMGSIRGYVHRKYDTSSDGRGRMVSDWDIAYESIYEYGTWLFGALCTGLFSWFVCVVARKETNVSQTIFLPHIEHIDDIERVRLWSLTTLLMFQFCIVYRMIKIQDKLSKAVGCLEYFTTHQWHFTDDNVRELLTHMSVTDRAKFQFDVTQIDWDGYFERYVLGLRAFLCKQNPKTLPSSRKKMNRYGNVTYITLFTIDHLTLFPLQCWLASKLLPTCSLYIIHQMSKVVLVLFTWRFLMARSKRLRDTWSSILRLIIQATRILPFF